jgi:hypothetical protein
LYCCRERLNGITNDTLPNNTTERRDLFESSR